MELSAEDSLRINVMLANQPLAIRIDESRMILHALTDKGEAQIQLNPNCKDEQYLKQIKELLSVHALGTPAGYPVHIQRWARMGQVQNDNLENLLCLGEPEAVVAVIYSADLSEEIARRAWWAMEEAENARQMLRVNSVVEGDLGKELANYLVEYLPFETETEAMMDTAELVLQPGLIDDSVRADLWKKARRKQALYAGFLTAGADSIPERTNSHHRSMECSKQLGEFQNSSSLATELLFALSEKGQSWLSALINILEKPADQDVVNRTLDITANHFSAIQGGKKMDELIEKLIEEARSWVTQDEEALQILGLCPDVKEQLIVLRVLSGLSYGVVRSVFSTSTAIGSLMRRKLQPIMEPLLAQVSIFLQ